LEYDGSMKFDGSSQSDRNRRSINNAAPMIEKVTVANGLTIEKG
jgi:hypothetical protein